MIIAKALLFSRLRKLFRDLEKESDRKKRSKSKWLDLQIQIGDLRIVPYLQPVDHNLFMLCWWGSDASEAQFSNRPTPLSCIVSQVSELQPILMILQKEIHSIGDVSAVFQANKEALTYLAAGHLAHGTLRSLVASHSGHIHPSLDSGWDL